MKELKSIQESVITPAIQRMNQCREQGDKDGFNEAKQTIRTALDSTGNADRKFFEKYSHLLDEEL